ncbi:MAG: electron transport complex subunit RsxE, partial [Succinimonas sp.]|nr:electron transport complex subunit RsxE [Succinimonas sp.]
MTIKEILKNGLWSKNPGLVQLLGLCPLLAVSSTAVNALGLGIATIMVLALSNFLISLTRKIIIHEIRIIIYVLIIASIVTCVELLREAYTPELYQALGLYIALIVTNCIIIARAETFASRNSVFHSFLDGLANG